VKIADTLDRQGEVILVRDVRYFAKNLPPALTDTERLAARFARHLASSLADCTSFVVMREMEIHAALTTDQHFSQAGFEVLLPTP